MFKGFIYVTLFSLFWAFQVTIGKFAMNKGIAPLIFTYQTLLGTALFACIFIYFTNKQDLRNIKTQGFLRLASVGLIGSGLANITSFYGLKYSTSINYGFLIKSTVVFSVLLAWMFLKEEINTKKSILIFVILFSAYLISTKGYGFTPNMGDIIILFSALCIASANVISKPILTDYSPEVLVFLRSLTGGILLLLILPFLSQDLLNTKGLELVSISSILSFGTLYFLNKTIEETSVSYLTMMSMMFSIFVAVLGFLFFQESMNSIQWIGASMIIICTFLIHKIKV